jgi:hypothetical protein
LAREAKIFLSDHHHRLPGGDENFVTPHRILGADAIALVA